MKEELRRLVEEKKMLELWEVMFHFGLSEEKAFELCKKVSRAYPNISFRNGILFKNEYREKVIAKEIAKLWNKVSKHLFKKKLLHYVEVSKILGVSPTKAHQLCRLFTYYINTVKFEKGWLVYEE